MVHKRSLQRLHPTAWLNDELMELFCNDIISQFPERVTIINSREFHLLKMATKNQSTNKTIAVNKICMFVGFLN